MYATVLRVLLMAAELCTFGVYVCVCDYFRDADGGPRSCPVRLDKVPLVSRHQVILHGLDEEIFAGVVVFDQGLFLHDLRRRDREKKRFHHSSAVKLVTGHSN